MTAAAVPAAQCAPDMRLSALGDERSLGDERLARRVALGDERAFVAIYERYHQPLFRYCRSILRDDGDAQDALQSTFENAFAALARARRDAPLRPWLFRIAHNQAITVTRRRATAAAPAAHLAPPAAASAEHEAAQRARLAALVHDLAQLPERLRGALVMRELGGLSHDEIAMALGISTAAAKQSIFEARRALLELAQGREMECDDVRRRVSDGDRRALRGRRIKAHLHDCAGCASFTAAISSRQADLRCLAPALPPAVAAAIFARASDGLLGHGVGGGTAGAAVGLSASGKGLATAALSKVAGCAAAVSTAAVSAGGVAVVADVVAGHHPRAPAARHVIHASLTAAASAPAGLIEPGRAVISRRALTSAQAGAAAGGPGFGSAAAPQLATVQRREAVPHSQATLPPAQPSLGPGAAGAPDSPNSSTAASSQPGAPGPGTADSSAHGPTPASPSSRGHESSSQPYGRTSRAGRQNGNTSGRGAPMVKTTRASIDRATQGQRASAAPAHNSASTLGQGNAGGRPRGVPGANSPTASVASTNHLTSAAVAR